MLRSTTPPELEVFNSTLTDVVQSVMTDAAQPSTAIGNPTHVYCVIVEHSDHLQDCFSVKTKISCP